jgi:hypothetical protein
MKQTKKQLHGRIKDVLVTIALICILGAIAIYVVKATPSSSPQPDQQAQQACTRTSPYPMPAEFERALSLIQERMQKSGKVDSNFHNCIDIQYANLHQLASPNTEGEFLFDPNSSSVNDLKIYVDSSYASYDDLTTAFLLSHELTHAKQFVDEAVSNKSVSCVEKEVGAFKNQFYFLAYLNNEEAQSLISRIEKGDSNNPQLEEMKNMWLSAGDIINQQIGDISGGISPEQKQQFDILLGDRLRAKIILMPEYQKECNL